MKITRSLSLKNKNNKIVRKIKIIYDVSLEKQVIISLKVLENTNK